ncbi:MAG: carboxypeptidase-like regulatory domain-containing protein [Labilibaculum antarcticum]
MKKTICLTGFLLLNLFLLNAQTRITGKVTDENKQALPGANVYIKGTVEGASTDTHGFFQFESTAKGEQILVVSCLGYQTHEKRDLIENLKDVILIMKQEELSLDEIVVTASTFSIGKSRTIKKMNALDVVLTGSSNGDIYGALQTLPGTQKVGEDGKLYVRGGETRESQTFIDGMHVLFPYTSTAQNTPARSKFSPFLFQGINLSLGGYDSEYGQALSSVLPMETKDVASSTKFGVNASPLSVGGGGTYAWEKTSLSANVNYTNKSLYSKVFPDDYQWKKDYRSLAGEVQLRSQLGRNSVHKLYLGVDRTAFIRSITDDLNNSPTRNFDLARDNYYINSTFTSRTKNNYQLFFGTAYSYASNKYQNTNLVGDTFSDHESELHAKAKIEKNVSRFYKIRGGFEAYIKSHSQTYEDNSMLILMDNNLNRNLYAGYIDNQFKLKKYLYANASARVEYSDVLNSWNLAPRLSLNYINDGFQASAIVGKYFQEQEDDVMFSKNTIGRQESCMHYILSGSYELDGTVLKVELYKKKYAGLGLLENDTYSSSGYGNSKGIDAYLSGESNSLRLKYTLAYSYNDSKRLYQDYAIESMPLFSTKHNASLSLRYSIPALKAYAGATHSYASGRPYQNPNKAGFINSKAPEYHSLDCNMTFLLSKNVILYSSVTNVLGRENVYGYTYSNTANTEGIYNRKPIVNSRKQFYYVGIFISLKSDNAYDVSSF